MKKPFSSSACSTMTTSNITASADATLYTFRSGCISTVFRRILRRNILATYPADDDRITEFCMSEKAKCSLHENNPNKAPGTPNLVAKLMGLDSNPIVNIKNELSSVTRSRPINFSETWKETVDLQGRPRRTKSFREMPCFSELEDDKFYILIFEDGNGNFKLESKEKRSEKGFTETEKLKEGGGKVSEEGKHSNENRGRNRRESLYEYNKENLIAEPTCSQKGGSEIVLHDKTNVQDRKGTIHSGKDLVVKLLEPLSKKKDSGGGKTRIKKRKDDFMDVETNETETDSKNSSPDSVLEDFQSPVNRSANNPEVSLILTRSKSRRILLEELENFRTLTNPEKDDTLICYDQGGKESIENVDGLSKIENIDNKIHAEILKESYKLAEEEMLISNWMSKEVWKLEDSEKVAENIEADILDHMINELVDQITAF